MNVKCFRMVVPICFMTLNLYQEKKSDWEWYGLIFLCVNVSEEVFSKPLFDLFFSLISVISKCNDSVFEVSFLSVFCVILSELKILFQQCASEIFQLKQCDKY